MKKILFLIVCFIISLSLIGCGGGGGGSSKSSKGNIIITVKNDKTLVKNTLVTIYNEKESFESTTDGEGKVSFMDIRAGEWKVGVKGFSVINNVTVVKNKTVEITLDVSSPSNNITFIFYGNSFDLDKGLTKNIKEMFEYGSTKNVNIIVMYKLSDNRVFRGKVVKTDGSDITYGLTELSPRLFSKASTLEEYITWAMDNYPAETYILNLWNHGSGWTPGFDNRSINHEYDASCMEIYELHRALMGKGIEYLNLDACSMEYIEVLTQLKDDVKWSIGCEEAVPSRGFNYNNLLTCLNTYGNIQEALIAFCKAQTEDPAWESVGTDIKFNDMSQVDNVNEKIKDISDFLQKNKDKYRTEIGNARKNTPNIYYMGKDMKCFLKNLLTETGDKDLAGLVKSFLETEQSLYIYKSRIYEKEGFLVNIPNKNVWEDNYKESYPRTAFAHATGWDKFLETL